MKGGACWYSLCTYKDTYKDTYIHLHICLRVDERRRLLILVAKHDRSHHAPPTAAQLAHELPNVLPVCNALFMCFVFQLALKKPCRPTATLWRVEHEWRVGRDNQISD